MEDLLNFRLIISVTIGIIIAVIIVLAAKKLFKLLIGIAIILVFIAIAWIAVKYMGVELFFSS